MWVALVSLVGSGSALLNYIPDKADVGGAWTTFQGGHREGCTHAEGVGDGKPRKINTRMDTIKVFFRLLRQGPLWNFGHDKEGM